MSGQIRVTSRYSGLLIYFVMFVEVVICGGLFTLFSHYLGSELGQEFLQSMSLICTIYFAVTIEGGVNLHMRRSKDYEVLLTVLKNVFYFSLLSVFILHIGQFYVFRWQYYLLYLLIMLMLLLTFRYSVRAFAKFYHQLPSNRRKVVMVGCTDNNVALYEELSDDKSQGFDVLGYFDDKIKNGFCGLPYLGGLDDVVDYFKTHKGIQEVYCSTMPDYRNNLVEEIINYCENNFMYYFSVPCMNNYLHQRMHLNVIGSIPYMNFFQDPLRTTSNRLIKRMFDIVVSFVFLVTIFPWLYLIVAIVTKITMPGPVFFRQKRSGMNGKEFMMYKFRSMKVNNESDTLQATKDDPRKTWWGNILRRTNIDEMPQFVNVLRGEMSVVGPRPHMLKHTEEYSKIINHYMVRHYIKPGITGWSQVTGFRGETKEIGQMEGRVKGDIWYMEHWSFWLDIYIIFRTIYNAIVGDKNAY